MGAVTQSRRIRAGGDRIGAQSRGALTAGVCGSSQRNGTSDKLSEITGVGQSHGEDAGVIVRRLVRHPVVRTVEGDRRLERAAYQRIEHDGAVLRRRLVVEGQDVVGTEEKLTDGSCAADRQLLPQPVADRTIAQQGQGRRVIAVFRVGGVQPELTGIVAPGTQVERVAMHVDFPLDRHVAREIGLGRSRLPTTQDGKKDANTYPDPAISIEGRSGFHSVTGCDWIFAGPYGYDIQRCGIPYRMFAWKPLSSIQTPT